MKQCWRWFGPEDPIGLSDLHQVGVEGIVTAFITFHQAKLGTGRLFLNGSQFYMLMDMPGMLLKACLCPKLSRHKQSGWQIILRLIKLVYMP